jgi:hypothetical protein
LKSKINTPIIPYLKQMRKEYQVAVDPVKQVIRQEDGKKSTDAYNHACMGYQCVNCNTVVKNDFMFWVGDDVWCSKCTRLDLLAKRF